VVGGSGEVSVTNGNIFWYMKWLLGEITERREHCELQLRSAATAETVSQSHCC